MGIVEIILLVILIGLLFGVVELSSVLWWLLVIVTVILTVRLIKSKDKDII